MPSEAEQAQLEDREDNLSALYYNNWVDVSNSIPAFVVCMSSLAPTVVYNRVQIWRTIELVEIDLQEYDPARRVWGPGWPRPLNPSYERLLANYDIGDAERPLYEYPLPASPNAGDESLDPDNVLDRIVVDRDAVFVGVLRYHDRERVPGSCIRAIGYGEAYVTPTGQVGIGGTAFEYVSGVGWSRGGVAGLLERVNRERRRRSQ
ncbi:hypothetical protein AAE478_009738 [Parahypoxylon ruwenzoriense]